MSQNENPEIVEGTVIETPEKTRRLPKLKLKLPNKTQLRNGLLIAVASAGSVLLLQEKLGKTVSLEVKTPDIIDPEDSNQD